MRVRRGALALALSAVAACGGDPAPAPDPPPPPDLLLSFDDGSLGATANTGTQDVIVSSVVGSSGSIEMEVGPDGSPAVRFPPYREPEPALAVLTVVAGEEGDFLSPGSSDFEFGVDFMLDPESEGGTDDGNNLVQRGLFSDAAQYKLQIDHGLVSCRVQGSLGEAVVVSAGAVDPDRWYRVRCSRQGDTVKLRVGRLDGSGEVEDFDESETITPTGTVTMAPDSPLSVGAKVLPTGEIVASSPDQFNGALDNVVYARLTA